VLPAILAGNSVILKHSAQTPLCAERLYEAFKEGGLPETVFQYLHLKHSDTKTVIKDERVKHVAFTGSVSGGEMVEKAVSGRFISVGLELGGKDPAYIRDDADLANAVDATMDGAFFNSGQSCCSIERIYVHELVYEEFVEKAVKWLKTLVLGRPDDPETTLGPLVRASAADFVRTQIREAIAQGAVGHIPVGEFPLDKIGSPYLGPQVLTNVNHTMRIMTEESFGPVIGIQKISSDQEAVKLMNESEFGLTAAIFTRDIDVGIELGQQVDAGTFFINRCDYLDPELAWTGVKKSGKGCSLSMFGYGALTRPKSFHIKTEA
jgi:acyl-CoA reductase-like NAD-dependent aldehyde dehydrogenase